MITPAHLMTLQAYSLHRQEHRRGLAHHQRLRAVGLGPHLRLQFEDELTVRHRIQEALWADPERQGTWAHDDIDACARLVPNGTQWKATLALALPAAVAEHEGLVPLLNAAVRELYVELRCRGHAPVRAMAHAQGDWPGAAGADAGLHCLRFQIEPAFRQGLASGGEALLGCSHPSYHWRRLIPPATLASLGRDLVQPLRRGRPQPQPLDDEATFA